MTLFVLSALAAAHLASPLAAASQAGPEAANPAEVQVPGAAEAPTVGTWFDGLGVPYGGCGIPQELLESQDFVALNVYHTPGAYASSPTRPLQGADTAVLGEFANGRNCGRWVEVTLGKYCRGTNDGAPGQPFCRGPGAVWVDDAYSGAVLHMLVADACGDGNAWCRDSRRHLDLSKPSLSKFAKDGKVLADLLPNHWNNRALEWKYVEAPAYQGDIRMHFMKGTQPYWVAVGIANLPNGIHGVEEKVDGLWKAAGRFSDMGQAFILTPADSMRIRIIDATDRLLQGGREYVFGRPSTCGRECTAAATPIAYRAYNPDGSPAAVRSDRKAQASPIKATYPYRWTSRLRDLLGRLGSSR